MNTPDPAQSPCVGICLVGREKDCVGCGRTLDEIAAWSSLSDSRKRAVNQAARVRLDASRTASADSFSVDGGLDDSF
jgi:uncharacterized protein